MNIFVRTVATFSIAAGLMKKLMNKLIAYLAIVLKPSVHFQGFLFITEKVQTKKVDLTVQAAIMVPAALVTIKSQLKLFFISNRIFFNNKWITYHKCYTFIVNY